MAPIKPVKSRLTKTRKTVDELVRESNVLAMYTLPTLESPEETRDILKGRKASIGQRIINLEESVAILKTAITALEDSFEKLSEEEQLREQASLEEYLEGAWDTTSNGEAMLGKLREKQVEIEARLECFEELLERRQRMELPQTGQASPATSMSSMQMQSLLPRLELPKFSGRRQQWDAFWAIFKTNIDEQPISSMMKFNYLLQALTGEARQVANRFQLKEENYELVIKELKRKYGKDTSIVEELLAQLENCTAESSSVKHQMDLLDQLSATLMQLSNKGQDINHRMILNTVLRKFNAEVQLKALEKRESLENISEWTWTVLQSHLMEILELADRVAKSQSTLNNRALPLMTVNRQGISSTSPCIYYKRTNHRAIDCRTVPEQHRMSYLTRNQLCLNCGRANHRAEECRRRGCFKCGLKHHTSICRSNIQTTTNRPSVFQNKAHPQRSDMDARKQTQAWTYRQQSHSQREGRTPINQNVITSEDEELTQNNPETETAVNQLSEEKAQAKKTILLTGMAKVKGPCKSKQVRILLDTGSELSFIHSKLIDELELQVQESSSLKIRTFGSTAIKEKQHRLVEVDLVDRQGRAHKCKLYDSPVISGTTSTSQLSEKDIEYIKKNKIEVSTSNSKEQPQILLGCDYLWEVMEGAKRRLPSGLYVISTKFGHMLSGRTVNNLENNKRQVMSTQSDKEVDTWDKYWSLESAGTNEYTGTDKDEKQLLEAKILKRFKETAVKRPEGYYVRLPWKDEHVVLPDNKQMALARLRSLFKQYRNREHELQEIDAIFKEQLKQGIIEVAPEETACNNNRVHYLSYQVILNPEKKTTPRRVVFDASAHPRGKPSLNDLLHQGPVILPNIIGILMRFRVGQIAITADIEKAFLQVRLHEKDRDVTRFLWVKYIGGPLNDHNIIAYRFTRVTFGLNASPFLLAATIEFHLHSTLNDCEYGRQITENMYVDNLLITVETTEEALQQYKRIKNIFNGLNMNMRGFISNDVNFMQSIAQTDKAEDTRAPKVLGIQWETAGDKLVIRCNTPQVSVITKRTVLKMQASIYDPLGWLLPLLIRAKIFFQSLWSKSYTWDEILSEEDIEWWRKLQESMQGFHKEIPRKVANKGAHCSLIAFSDASATSMAACIYIRDNCDRHLVIAKSKLPSIKSQHTIPKMEMNAMTIAARLLLTVYQELKQKVTIKSVYLLSDSEIVLSWLKTANDSRTTGVLVSNRAREVRMIADKLSADNIEVYFGYVSTKANPADCATRGLNAEELKFHTWWKGPQFIQGHHDTWPKESHLFQLNHPQGGTSDILHISTTSQSQKLIDCERFSSMSQLKRTVAIVLKFLRRCSRNLPPETQERLSSVLGDCADKDASITPTDLKLAEMKVLKNHQNQFLQTFTAALHRKLNVRQDHDGLSRCYGRLGKSYLAADTKNPVLVASNTHLAKLLIREAHGHYHHSTAHTMCEVRKNYWIPRLRQQVKQYIRQCVPCQRYNSFPYRYPPLADLPRDRVIKSRTFANVGLDLFGPLKTRSKEAIQKKAYGCIFTCATTRLVHIELVTDLTTTSFLNAMRRFMSRRGIPNIITSDNAAAFILANQILSDSLEIDTVMTNRGITWRKITPYAPWQGGFYERLIKDIKRALFKALGRNIVDEDSLHTILTEIEACLNNRPLTYQETDIEDITPLRPIDFLQKDLCISYRTHTSDRTDPDFHTPTEEAQLRTRLEAEQALRASTEIVDKFWQEWQNAYLTSLREQHIHHLTQGRSTTSTPKVGQVVLIQDNTQPRNKWKLAKILSLERSGDGEVRQVHIKTGNGKVTKRPISILVPLEVDSDTHQNRQRDAEEHTDTLGNTPVIQDQHQDTRYNLRVRKKNNYPYNQDYEVYLIQTESSSLQNERRTNQNFEQNLHAVPEDIRQIRGAGKEGGKTRGAPTRSPNQHGRATTETEGAERRGSKGGRAGHPGRAGHSHSSGQLRRPSSPAGVCWIAAPIAAPSQRRSTRDASL